jgi:hypothetical protein
VLDHPDARDAIERHPGQVAVVAKLDFGAIAQAEPFDAPIGFVELHAAEGNAERLCAALGCSDDE